MWAAAITSVVGSAYTSITFLRGIIPGAENHRRTLVTAFIIISTLIFVLIGRPVALLVGAGALNGLILPLALGTILLATRNTLIVGTYRHPRWLLVLGILVVGVMGYLGGRTLLVELPKLLQ